MKRKNQTAKTPIVICFCAVLLLFSVIGLLFAVLPSGSRINALNDFDKYREQLINLNENYDVENRVIVISDRKINDRNAIAYAAGFGDVYVLQYANTVDAKNALAYYNSLSYATAMKDSVVKTQESTADGDFDIVVLDHLSWGAEILGVDSYQRAIEQKYKYTALPDVYVAVLDTGIDTDNEFLQGRIAFEYGTSYCTSDLYNNGKSKYKFEDDHMHGTHVAGTIVDLTLPNVKIIPIKVLDSSGSGDVSYIISAMKYIMELKEEKGLNIVAANMSLAADSTGNESTLVFDQAYQNNIMSVVAAGNDSYYAEDYFPANCKSALTVSALSQNVIYENFPFVSYYSNYGSNVDLCLPGTNVLSCVPDGYNYSQDYLYSTTGGTYAYLSGTSMATPHASALVALYATYMGESYNTAKVEKAIKNNSYDLGDLGRDDLFGYGVPTMDIALSDRELLATPTLSFGEVGAACHFDGSITVDITNNNPTYRDMTYEIYYTLDGSYPMICGNRMEYCGAIELDESTHLSFVIYLFDSDGFVRGHSALYEVEYFEGEEQDKNTIGTGFEINQNGILTKYTSGIQDVVIPKYVNGKEVRELGNNLFFGLNVRSIVCEADISLYNKTSKNLEYPIRYCPNLKSVTLGSSDATYAVSHCFGLKELILLNATKIADAAFPSFTLGYSYLGSYTVYGCASIERIEAHNAKSVGSYAFNYVTTIKELVLPQVTVIYSNAFIECTALTELDLPSAFYIDNNAFKDCYNLKTVHLPSIQNIESYAFANCTALTEIDVDATTIGTGAFFGCTALSTIKLSSVETIKDGAFEKCEKLKWLDLSNVKSIGEATMRHCTELRIIYCGSNSYIINQSVKWADWLYRYGNLQYLVVDYLCITRGGLLLNHFYDCTVIQNYRIYSRTPLYTATYQDGNGDIIASYYHSGKDAIIPPEVELHDDYVINYLSWRSSDGTIFGRGDKVYLTTDETFTLADYNTYYFAYAEQAKQQYAAMYEMLNGNAPTFSAAKSVYEAIESACTFNNSGLQVEISKTDVVKTVNNIIETALCEIIDELALPTDSDTVIGIFAQLKADIANAVVDAIEIVDLEDIIASVLRSVEEQRIIDAELAKTSAKSDIRDAIDDFCENLSTERSGEIKELYQKYESLLETATHSEYENIVTDFNKELIIRQVKWAIDDLLIGNEDDGILEIVDKAKSDINLLADKSIPEEHLKDELMQIANKAEDDIKAYLESRDGSTDPDDGDDDKTPEEPDPNGPDDGDDNDGEDPKDPNNPDDGGDEPKEPENPDGGDDDNKEPETPDSGDDDNKESEDSDSSDDDATDSEQPDNGSIDNNPAAPSKGDDTPKPDNTIMIVVFVVVGAAIIAIVATVAFLIIKKRRK
ncbi:MAG: leucine-rich repeat protein [Clostridiales bacterium]|nr:leucine-rich repeat protein [Clostridiales bacterium]